MLANSITRGGHLHVLSRFAHKSLSVLITASITTHNLRVPTIARIFGCSLPSSYRSCIRHVNQANHTNTDNRSVDLTYRRCTLGLPTVRACVNRSVPMDGCGPSTLVASLPGPLHLAHPHANGNPHHANTPHGHHHSNWEGGIVLRVVRTMSE